MKRIILTILALTLVLAACSDDDPVQPVPEPVPDPVATSPDSLMSLYRIAVEELEIEGFDNLFHPEFRMGVSAWEGNFGDLPTDYMSRDETVLAAANMFGGEMLTNWQGDAMPAVTRINIYGWERVSEWVSPPAPDGPGIPAIAVASSIWSLRLFIERGEGYPILAAAGKYSVSAVAGLVDDEPAWVLSSMSILEGDKSETYGWAGVNLLHLTNEAPTAVLDVTETPTDTWPKYTFDPTDSTDDDSGLADLPFRFRESGEIFIGPPPPWTEWTTEPYEVTFTSGEDHPVTVEVRDRWGATAMATKTVQPVRAPMPYPDTPQQLMENFVITYEQRSFDDFRNLMHDDFLMILQQETIDLFPDLGPTLELDEELRIAERMFSGDDVTDPNGEFVPGVQDIIFEVFEPLDVWQVSPSDDPIPNAYFAPYDVGIRFNRGQGASLIRVQGQIRFYVTSRDSLHQGSVQQYHEMVGQVDLTSHSKAVEAASWGIAKGLFR